MSFQDRFMNAPREYSVAPFWFLNDALDETELKRQIHDFAAHGVYGFIPHARIGLPEDIEFMSEKWLRFLKVCTDYAASKDMFVVLYDEGMYPSGSASGQVVRGFPQLATRCIQERALAPIEADEEVVWEADGRQYVNTRSRGTIRGVHYGQDDGEPGAPPSADILNPDAVMRFLHLVHDRHYEVLGEHFGKTVKAIFTDEPSVLGRGHIKDVYAWTWGFEDFLENFLGYDFRPHLPALFSTDHAEHGPRALDFQRAVNARLEAAYYAPYSEWCGDHGVALTGHPSAPDDIGTMKYFHLPGQDIVWRYIEPGKESAIEGPQSTMAKCSASAQHHYGRKRNANECFGAYGWEFTESEMWWITNWLFVRGVNMIYPHAFYYSMRDERRNERPPDVGPNSAWWGRYSEYADYCRRMCWLIAESEPVCSIAILGTPTSLPWRAARALFETQRNFMYLDHDTLLNECEVDHESIRIRGLEYKAAIVDGPEYITEVVAKRLRSFVDAGRLLAYVEGAGNGLRHAPDAATLDQIIETLVAREVRLEPSSPHVRCLPLRHDGRPVYLLANEGPEHVETTIAVGETELAWWNPRSVSRHDGDPRVLSLAPGEIKILA